MSGKSGVCWVSVSVSVTQEGREEEREHLGGKRPKRIE